MRGHSRGRPTGGAAGHEKALLVASQRLTRPGGVAVRGQPRRGDGAVVGGLVGRAHGEFVHVQLAQHDRAIAPQMGGDGGFIVRLEPIEDMAAGLRMNALGGVEILDPQGKTLKGARRSAGDARVGGGGHGQSLLGGLEHIGVEPARLGHGVEMGLGQFNGGKRPGGERVARLREGEACHVGHVCLSGRGRRKESRGEGPGLAPIPRPWAR